MTHLGWKPAYVLAMTGLMLAVSAALSADPLTVKTEQGKVSPPEYIGDGKVEGVSGTALRGTTVGRPALEGAATRGKVEGHTRSDCLRCALCAESCF